MNTGAPEMKRTQTLDHWRNAMLQRIVPALVGIGAIALVTSSIDMLRATTPSEQAPVIGRIMLYIVAFCFIGALIHHRKRSMAFRAGTALASLYTIGVIELQFLWFGRDGMLLVFAAIALTTLFFGLRDAIGMLVATSLLLLIMALAPWLTWLEFPFEGLIAVRDIMFDELLLFDFLVIIVIIPANYLLRSLEQSVTIADTNARKAEENARRFELQARELREKNRRLEQVECELRETVARTERQLAHIQAMQQIDQAIITQQDVYNTLDTTLAQLITQLEVDGASIWIANQVDDTFDHAVSKSVSTITELPSPQATANHTHWVDSSKRHTSSATPPQRSNGYVGPLIHTQSTFAAHLSLPLVVRDQLKGVLEVYGHRPFPANSEWLNFLHGLAGQVVSAIDHAELLAEIQRSTDELAIAYDATIVALARALELRDAETEGHCQRVTMLTMRMAEALGFSEEEKVQIKRGAILHDIGKIAVPDAILLKPGPLTEAEYTIMQRHTVYAYDMLSPIPFLRPALDIPYCHHEKWDGSGYPRRLKREEIPLAARMFALVDVYDALSSDRPYRRHWSEERIYDYLASHAGTHFDPDVLKIFFQQLTPSE
jgi:HD-GYP domain-containing protein (c-di-GMP phosphodiesterase class II)